jgi:hypothetical protein
MPPMSTKEDDVALRRLERLELRLSRQHELASALRELHDVEREARADVRNQVGAELEIDVRRRRKCAEPVDVDFNSTLDDPRHEPHHRRLVR